LIKLLNRTLFPAVWAIFRCPFVFWLLGHLLNIP
jgi:hypothetical protein